MNGTILHYDGQSWIAEASGTTSSLLDVWGSLNDMRAVGDHGVILKRTEPCVIIPTALTDLGADIDDDGAVGAAPAILQVYDSYSLQSLPGVLIGSYQASMAYNGTLLEVLDARLKAPFDTGNVAIDNLAGLTTFDASVLMGTPWPVDPLAFAVLRLTGCVTDSVTLTPSFDQVLDDGGNPLAVDPLTAKTLRRGDAKADGTVNVADALFIAQYLAGLREIGEGLNLVHAVNSASVKQDGTFDVISVADALYILQHEVGFKDDCFNLGAPPPEPTPTPSPGSCIFNWVTRDADPNTPGEQIWIQIGEPIEYTVHVLNCSSDPASKNVRRIVALLAPEMDYVPGTSGGTVFQGWPPEASKEPEVSRCDGSTTLPDHDYAGCQANDNSLLLGWPSASGIFSGAEAVKLAGQEVKVLTFEATATNSGIFYVDISICFFGANASTCDIEITGDEFKQVAPVVVTP